MKSPQNNFCGLFFYKLSIYLVNIRNYYKFLVIFVKSSIINKISAISIA